MNFLRRVLDERLKPPYLWLVSIAILLVGSSLAIIAFVTSDRGRSAVGIPFGADFAGFYVAAQILDQGQPQQLYDRDLHNRLYHELLPNLDEKETIPYVHPPFVAGLLRPLTWMKYDWAVPVWLFISANLYVGGILLLFQSLPALPKEQRGLILLLCLSFEPFLFECWIGGQLSALGFFSYALCFFALQRGKPLAAGMALGICFYKPTLLFLILPLLIVGRRWRMLLGLCITGLALGTLSVLLAGLEVNVGYLEVLLSFRKSAAGSDLAIRTWKYVDLNNSLRLILGNGSPFQLPLLLGLTLIPFALLIRHWWSWNRLDQTARQLLWAATLTWLPVLNLYVGTYDSILMVQGALFTAAVVCQSVKSATPLTTSGLAYLLLLIYLAPWFSQNLARTTGIPLYTLVLAGLGGYQLWHLRAEPRPSGAERNSTKTPGK